jgi:pimeloyl-ACP methyl ester carboxylesterase
LLHGFPDTAYLWRNQVPALTEAGYKTVAPDLRGYGDTDKPEGVDNYSIVHILADLVALLDHLEIERAHLVGHDWGAATAWVFASFAPERTRSLTALSVGHPAGLSSAGPEQLARSWYMFMFQFEGVAEEWISRNDWEFARAMLGETSDLDHNLQYLSKPGALTAALNWYRANIPPQSWYQGPPEIPPITVPSMGVWSSGDIALTETQMTLSEKYVTGEWRYERLDDIGHWIPLEAPDDLNRLLLDFIPTA